MHNIKRSYCLLTCMFSRFSLHSASNLISTLICAERKNGCCHLLLEPYMAEMITFLRGCLFRVSKFGRINRGCVVELTIVIRSSNGVRKT